MTVICSPGGVYLQALLSNSEMMRVKIAKSVTIGGKSEINANF